MRASWWLIIHTSCIVFQSTQPTLHTKKSILIVEHKKEVAQSLSATLSSIGYNVVDCATSMDEALDQITFSHPDLILLDFKLKDNGEGLKLGELIYNELHTPFVYIVRNECKNTLDSIMKTHPNGILLHDQNVCVNNLYVETTIELAFSEDQNQFSSNSQTATLRTINELQNGLFIKTGDLYKKIMFEDILWLEGDDNYTLIYTKNRKFAIKKVLKSLEEILPKNQFLRIHKSYIVQLGKITSVNYKSVFLDDKVIPMSRQIRPEFMAMMNVV